MPNGLNLVKLHGDTFAVSDEFADQVIAFYEDIPANYLSDVAALVKEDVREYNEHQKRLDAFAESNPEKSAFSEFLRNGVLYIDLKGEIVQATSSFSLFSSRSYVSLNRLNQILDRVESEYSRGVKDVKAVGFIVDSPGGVAFPSLNMAERVKKMNSEVLPIYSFFENMAASSGYAVPCGSQEIWSSKYCDIGSIGCVSTLVNTTPADKAAGIEVVYKTSGKNKRPFTKNEDGTLSKEGHNYLQNIANEGGQLFTDFVFSTRNITDQKKAEIADAGVFLPEKALELGLIDKIGSLQEFRKYVEEKVGNGMSGKGAGDSGSGTSDDNVTMKVTGVNSSLSNDQKELIEFCTENKLTVEDLKSLVSIKENVRKGLEEEVCSLYTAVTGEEPSEDRKKNFAGMSDEQLKELSADYDKIQSKSGNPVRKTAEAGITEKVLSPREAAEKFGEGLN